MIVRAARHLYRLRTEVVWARSCKIRLSGLGNRLHKAVQWIAKYLQQRGLRMGAWGWHMCCLTPGQLHRVSQHWQVPMAATLNWRKYEQP